MMKVKIKDRFLSPYTERELLADLTPENAHADELAKLTASESCYYAPASGCGEH